MYIDRRDAQRRGENIHLSQLDVPQSAFVQGQGCARRRLGHGHIVHVCGQGGRQKSHRGTQKPNLFQRGT